MIFRTARSLVVAAAVAMPLLTGTSDAATISTLYNTGVDPSNAVLDHGVADPHYTITSAPPGSSTADRTIVTGYPIGSWLANNTTSRWIGPANVTSGNPNDPVGTYTFTTTFDLTGYVASSAVITGRWATDNKGSNILINGFSTGQTATSYSAWTSFSIDPTKLVSGLNTLTFLVLNESCNCDNPAGLRVEFTTATASPVPLPAPLVLLASGLAALGFLGRRRKAKAVAA